MHRRTPMVIILIDAFFAEKEVDEKKLLRRLRRKVFLRRCWRRLRGRDPDEIEF